MGIKIHPRIGAILACDYTGFRAPEMIKRRPVVVVSPRLRHRDGLCSVIPLSTMEPHRIELYHCVLTFDPPLPRPYDSGTHWVKADMIATVGFHRLSPLKTGKDQDGKRQFDNRHLNDLQLQQVRECLLQALGLGNA